ncbi:unannotated protein [freshwater metagenome]|uniref:Unannotated protein n=1 Tax=freshwater metagenome TaxID=449393 RepID=A0A6J6CW53_9ZZZZ|nr:peroxide stress protein YaaA [Actinomycetota bacterium]
MIFLLPPSETKEPGGKKKPKKLSHKELDKARELLQQALMDVCKSPKLASKALKLGPKQMGEIQVNLDLASPKFLPALDRYTGTLYDALKLGGVSATMRARAGKAVFIQSSLFGLICASDEIPNYRLSAGSKLPGINLKSLWQQAHEVIWSRFSKEIVIDMRSNSYAELAPIPKTLSCYTLDVVLEDKKGKRTRLNHFNKQAKGQFLRSVLLQSPAPKTIADLKATAKSVNLKLESSGKELLLVTFS